MTIIDPTVCLAEIQEIVSRVQNGLQPASELSRATELLTELDSFIATTPEVEEEVPVDEG
jgi:hypothetical protein